MSDFITRENLSVDTVKAIFDSAFMTTSLEGNSLTVRDNHTWRVDIDEGKRYIDFFTLVTDEEHDQSFKIAKANQINSSIITLELIY
jgi:hypothetical protein